MSSGGVCLFPRAQRPGLGSGSARYRAGTVIDEIVRVVAPEPLRVQQRDDAGIDPDVAVASESCERAIDLRPACAHHRPKDFLRNASTDSHTFGTRLPVQYSEVEKSPRYPPAKVLVGSQDHRLGVLAYQVGQSRESPPHRRGVMLEESRERLPIDRKSDAGFGCN